MRKYALRGRSSQPALCCLRLSRLFYFLFQLIAHFTRFICIKPVWGWDVSRVRDPPYIQVQVYWTVLIFCVDFPLHRWCESISRRYSCRGILRSQQMNLQRWTNLSARMFRRACGPSWSPMPAHGITSMWKTYLLSLPGKSKHWCSEGVFNRSKSVSTSPIKMKSRIRSWSVLTVDFPFAQANL